jgi:MFS family permease
MMDPTKESQFRDRLKTPRAAAVAGILFSMLFIASMVLIRSSIPLEPHDVAAWQPQRWKTIALALNLLPFAGIAFLWFIGVLRDRIGVREDRLFATVFLGSGILFLAMLFCFAAVAGGMAVLCQSNAANLMDANVFAFARAMTQQIIKVYGMRMAGVFMMLTSTLAIRAGIFPRWIAFLGYALAALLMISLGRVQWISLVFPLWVLLLSVYILIAGEKTENLSKGSMSDGKR